MLTLSFSNGYSVLVRPTEDKLNCIFYWPTVDASKVDTYEDQSDTSVARILNDIANFNVYLSDDDIARMEYEEDKRR